MTHRSLSSTDIFYSPYNIRPNPEQCSRALRILSHSLIQYTAGNCPKYNRLYSIRNSRFSKVPPGYGKGHKS